MTNDTGSGATSREHDGPRRRRVELVLLALLVVAAFAARLPFREAVLTRDEGEYFQMGQAILAGSVPYADVYNQKTPFTFYFLALVQQLAGPSLGAARIATALWGVLTILLVHALARRLLGATPALFAALAFAVMTFDQSGILHPCTTEFFMLGWAAAALVLWYRPRRERASHWGWRWSAVAAGAAVAMAYQSKQTALVLLVFLVVDAAWRVLVAWRAEGRGAWRDAALDVTGALVGFVLVTLAVLGFFATQGALAPYVECTWRNNLEYVGTRWYEPARAAELARAAVVDVARQDLGLWIAGALGLAWLAARSLRRPREPEASGGGLWMLLGGVVLGALATGETYQHYWQPVILPAALGCGVLFGRCLDALRRGGVAVAWRVVAAAVLVLPFVAPAKRNLGIATLSAAERAALLRFEDELPTFGLAAEAGEYLRERTAPGEPILVIGSEPQIYFHAQRPAATRMVISYPMIAPYTFSEPLREAYYEELRQDPPRYLVLVRVLQSHSEFPRLVGAHIGKVMDMLSADYRLEAMLPRGSRRNEGDVFHVYRRKDG